MTATRKSRAITNQERHWQNVDVTAWRDGHFVGAWCRATPGHRCPGGAVGERPSSPLFI